MLSFLSRLFIRLTSVKYSPYTERDATKNFERWWKRHGPGYKGIVSLIGLDAAQEYARLQIKFYQNLVYDDSGKAIGVSSHWQDHKIV